VPRLAGMSSCLEGMGSSPGPGCGGDPIERCSRRGRAPALRPHASPGTAGVSPTGGLAGGRSSAGARAYNLRMAHEPSDPAAVVRSCLEHVPDLVAAWLFGSVVRGTATPRSDVDVGILLRQAPPRTLEGRFFAVAFSIEERLGRPADVVILNDAPVDLVHRVLRDGRLVLERDRSARIRFEARARREYFDLLPVLLHYRRMGAAPAAAERRR
jgi:predicted nucleotidyltransferase